MKIRKQIAAAGILLAAMAGAGAALSPALATAAPNSAGINQKAPQWRVGAGVGSYLYLTPAEQQMVAAGGAAALGATICGATVGLACPAVAGALAASAAWISANGGVCPGELEIRQIIGNPMFKCV
ncbi:Secreted protein [Nocardia ninae]|uniref:Secreted protein n=1 Tax=Nocardia ninae NBRC 108245 TaxID=1210091 RepID=A0A511MBU2_9NOCA|nr:hypothetical protein NN4_26510 [Nocardia ninae NBRC 108245]